MGQEVTLRRAALVLWQFIRAFGNIYLCLYAGIGISTLLPITIPGSIVGMLILFILLCFQLIPVEWVKPGCNLFIRYMALLFVPISVGVINDIDILKAQFAPIVVSCLVSTVIVLVAVGLLTQRMHRQATAAEEERYE